MSSLKKLSICMAGHISPAGFIQLSSLKKLQSLDVSDCSCVTAEVMQVFVNIPLTELTIRRCDIDDECFEVVCQMKSLVKLDMEDNDSISSSMLCKLSSLVNLQYLDMSFCRLPVEGIRAISDIGLTEMFLDYCGIDDECLAVVSNITSLRKLGIIGNRITKAGLVHLASLQHLEYILIDSRLYEAADLAGIKYRNGLSRK